MLPLNSVLFVSDIHLSEQAPQLTELFMQFLQGPALDAKAVYVLGDLFDVWVGEDLSPPFHKALFNAFNALTHNHVELYFMPGNRDFLVSASFLQTVSAKRLNDRSVIDLHGIPTLLMHGDLLCTHDKGYQHYRKIAQHPLTRYLFLKLPRHTRDKIAKTLREKSKSYQRTKPLSILDVDNSAVELEMKSLNVRQLIHGHVHRPAIHDLQVNNQSAKRAVLGDWTEKTGSLILSTPSEITLAEFHNNGSIAPKQVYTLEEAFPLTIA